MKFWSWFKGCPHKWERYDVLVEQLFTGGHYAWQKCAACGKVKFAKADRNTPEQPGWKERAAKVAEIMRSENKP